MKKMNNKGFSLVELIIVIAIMAVLIAVLAPQYLKYVEKSRVSADGQTADEFLGAIQVLASDPDLGDSLDTSVKYGITNSGKTITVTDDSAKHLNAIVDYTSKTPSFKSKTYQGYSVKVYIEWDATNKVWKVVNDQPSTTS